MNKPFVVTTGEPAGIGPDISLSIACRADASDFVLFGNLSLLEERARVLDLRLSFICLLYTSPSPRDRSLSRMPSSA